MKNMSSFAYIRECINFGVTRFRHPYSLPEEVGKDLGWEMTNQMSFSCLIHCLIEQKSPPPKLKKFMSRREALEVFRHALRAERFHQKVIVSYQFKQGSVDFELSFDGEDRLRRVRIQAPNIKSDAGHEILLSRETGKLV